MEVFQQAKDVADQIVAKVGKTIVLGIPLGAGKPNHIVNALYDKVANDPSLHLKILSALTLNKPGGGSLLESRFMGPFADRVFGDYPNLKYETDRAAGRLPKNIEVIEFYFPAGKQLNNKNSQCNYISSNYTHVARDLLDLGVNVLGNLVAPDEAGGCVSLSCNADITTDVLEMLKKNGRDHVFAVQVNHNLPFMYGDGIIPRADIDIILENKELHFPIFAPPKLSVPDKDHLIGFYASTLIKDGGELQVGIGSLGDALVYSLLMRHEDEESYKEVLDEFEVAERYSSLLIRKGDTAPFQEGLFGATEMFVDGFMHLIKAGILKRKVYDHIILQRLINERIISEEVTSETLFHLLERRAIQPQLSEKDFNFLKKFGVFKENLSFEHGRIITADGHKIEANLNEDIHFQKILSECLGTKLKNGAIIHGGFFIGCNDFYNWLRNMSDEERRLIHMKPVSRINQLYGHEELDRLHRKNARFVNTCLMMTLMGGAVSDGLEDGRVISGVGGQYNFVAMAHALPDGHSVIQLRSTRHGKNGLESNIVFNYGHITIPRHLRDIVISEYGIADIRGKSDSDVAAALIEIADSQFQEELIAQAKSAGKLRANYELPATARNNTEDMLNEKIKRLKAKGLFPKFPFGTELTDIEIQVGAALKSLKKKKNDKKEMAKLMAQAALTLSVPQEFEAAISRMKLSDPQNFKEKLYQKLLISELQNLKV